jgi:hypothetical protein
VDDRTDHAASALSALGGGGTWWANIQAWLKEYDVDWCWWALNPTHGQSCTPGTSHIQNTWGALEPYGLLTVDWTSVGYPAVVTMLQALMQPPHRPGNLLTAGIRPLLTVSAGLSVLRRH